MHAQLAFDRYHPRPLATPAEVRRAVHYVLNNWRRHREDRDAHHRRDPYRSAASFADWNPRPPSETYPHRERRPVVVPSTWLLAIGWRRRGGISPFARPGSLDRRA